MKKSKKIQTTEYYSLSKILSHPSSYYMIIGERSNGKTYSVKKRIIEKAKEGGEFVYLRRLHRYIVRKKMFKVFDDIQDIALKELDSKMFYSTEQGFFIDNETEIKSIGYVTSLEDGMSEKGVSFHNVKTILFDEFIDESYSDIEIERFLNLISTICRERDDVEIFMLGNTVSRYCPYFDLFGIDIKKVKQGNIYRYSHLNGVTCSLEYCKNKVQQIGKNKTNKYTGFDNNKTVDMIMYGDWEYAETNTKSVDGIGWSSNRQLIPAYVTALGLCYEMSIYSSKHPIAFVRKPNTQNGLVKERIKYNLSYDNSVLLNSKSGVVPRFSKVSKFFDESTIEQLEILNECIKCSRIVFDTYETGTEFLKAYEKIG